MTKKNLKKVVADLMYKNSEVKSGDFSFDGVMDNGYGYIKVTDHKHLDHNECYEYYDVDENFQKSVNVITNLIWNEWNIKENA